MLDTADILISGNVKVRDVAVCRRLSLQEVSLLPR